MPDNSQKEQPRRRQARGERRIAQLLEAAANVFCTTGYTAASTNAIAREAGVSPGTLYQFFPNKEAIAIELGDRLMHEMREAYGEALAPVDPATPLEEAVGSAVDRFIAFSCDHPVFFALMHGPDIPGRIAEEHDALHATLVSRIEGLLLSLLPDAPRPTSPVPHTSASGCTRRAWSCSSPTRAPSARRTRTRSRTYWSAISNPGRRPARQGGFRGDPNRLTNHSTATASSVASSWIGTP